MFIRYIMCVVCFLSLAVASKLGGAFFDYGLRNELSPVPKNAITRLETLLGGLRTTPIEVFGLFYTASWSFSYASAFKIGP